jgi:hypothetical protein
MGARTPLEAFDQLNDAIEHATGPPLSSYSIRRTSAPFEIGNWLF